MKYTVLLFTLLLIVSCGGGESAETDTLANQAESTTPPAAPAAEVAIPNNPCEKISANDVAMALGWTGATDGIAKEFFEKRLQGCEFTGNGIEGGLAASITSSQPRTIQNKGLERAFTTDLEDNDRLTFRDAGNGIGDQSIYGYGKRGPNYLYILRWRDGNEYDYKLEYRSSKELDEAAVLTQLNALATKM